MDFVMGEFGSRCHQTPRSGFGILYTLNENESRLSGHGRLGNQPASAMNSGSWSPPIRLGSSMSSMSWWNASRCDTLDEHGWTIFKPFQSSSQRKKTISRVEGFPAPIVAGRQAPWKHKTVETSSSGNQLKHHASHVPTYWRWSKACSKTVTGNW